MARTRRAVEAALLSGLPDENIRRLHTSPCILTQMNVKLQHVHHDLTGMDIIEAIVRGERSAQAAPAIPGPRTRRQSQVAAGTLATHEPSPGTIPGVSGQDCRVRWGESRERFEDTDGGPWLRIEERAPLRCPEPGGPDITVSRDQLMTKWPTPRINMSFRITGGRVMSSKTKASSNRAAAGCDWRPTRCIAPTVAFLRRKHLGAPKAITATAHKLARIIYSMLRYGQGYVEVLRESVPGKGVAGREAKSGAQLVPLSEWHRLCLTHQWPVGMNDG